ncbi:MAG: hypothetical protein ACI9OU_002431, partial [Candidatus Promineifilaceae bacterium]
STRKLPGMAQATALSAPATTIHVSMLVQIMLAPRAGK